MPIYARAHQKVTHIWSEDPAIEWSKDPSQDNGTTEAKYEDFKKTGDTTKLTYKPGQTPVLFELKSLTHAQKLRVGDEIAVAAARRQAVGENSIAAQMLLYVPCATLVAYGLVAAKGMLDDAGQPLELKRDGERLTEATMEALSYPSLIIEVGLRIHEISSPDPTRGQA